MLEGINLDQRIEYSCKGDHEPKTVFVFKPLSGFEMLGLSSHFQGDQLTLNSGYIQEILGMSIIEIKHPDISSEGDVKRFISVQAIGVLTELTMKAMSVNHLMDEESKN